MSPETLAKLRLTLVTDRTATAGRPLLEVVESALGGGVRAVQLRERDLGTRELVELASGLRDLTSRRGALLLINDRVDVALACGADGVHLPARSLSVRDARALLPAGRLVGVSTHSVEEVRAAAEDGADFVVFGPIFDTPSKREFGAPLGLGALDEACSSGSMPVVAIGGIDAGNAAACRARGAAGVAVIRAVLAALDPQGAARTLFEALEP